MLPSAASTQLWKLCPETLTFCSQKSRMTNARVPATTVFTAAATKYSKEV